MSFKIFAGIILSIFATGYSIDPYGFYHPPLHPRLFFLKPSLASASVIQSCTTTSGITGSCVDIFTCIFRGGTPAGKCGFGLKACCAATAAVTSLPFAILSNPTNTLTIRPTSIAYCQVRLDFTTFNVGGTDRDGLCTGGTFSVTGQLDPNVPTICGQNTGQHIYLNFGSNSAITLNINSASALDTWNIMVTQVPCSDTQNIAPAGCLQYFPGPTGNVKSFNYVNVIVDRNNVTYQPANNNYLVCVDKSSSFSTITWTRDISSRYSFTIDSVVPVIPSNLLGTVAAATVGINCTTDFVGIPGGQYTAFDGTSQISSQFCGLGFPSQVVSSSLIKPFTIQVFTNENELLSGDQGNVGFSLNFDLS